MENKSIKLFGCIIPVQVQPPPFKLFGYTIHVAPAPAPAPVAEESDSGSTANTSESVVLNPEPLRMYIPDENIGRRREPENNLPAEFLRWIDPARPVFLYQKELTKTDVDEHQNRLLVTDTERLNQFLTEEEREMAKVEVKAFDMRRTEFELTLSKRGERKILRKKWSRMLRDNQVEPLDLVDVWGFRHGPNNEIRLALVFTKNN